MTLPPTAVTSLKADAAHLNYLREAQSVIEGQLDPSWQLVAALVTILDAYRERCTILAEAVDIRDQVLHDLTGGVWNHALPTMEH